MGGGSAGRVLGGDLHRVDRRAVRRLDSDRRGLRAVAEVPPVVSQWWIGSSVVVRRSGSTTEVGPLPIGAVGQESDQWLRQHGRRRAGLCVAQMVGCAVAGLVPRMPVMALHVVNRGLPRASESLNSVGSLRCKPVRLMQVLVDRADRTRAVRMDLHRQVWGEAHGEKSCPRDGDFFDAC